MSSRNAQTILLLTLSMLRPPALGRTELAQVAVAGCEQLNRGAVCELSGRELWLWHDGPLLLEVYAPDARAWISYAATRVGTGRLYRVPVRADQRLLQMRLRARVESPVLARQLLRLRAADHWAWQAQAEATTNEQAREQLSRRLMQTRGAERAYLLYELSRREYRTGRDAEARQHLQAAASLAQALGLVSHARSCLGLMARHAATAHDFVVANAAWAGAQQLADPAEGVIDTDGRALLAHRRGILATELAALHDAADAYDEAMTWVERGAFALAGHVRNGLAMVSVLQGRLVRAHELYTSLLHSAQAERDVCFRAITLGHLGWVELELLRAHAAEPATSEDATRHLRESVASFEQCRAGADWRPAHARLSLAYDALRRGDLAEARDGLAAAGNFEGEPRIAQYRALLAAEVGLAEGHAAAAVEHFAELHAQWQGTASIELGFRALDGLGRALLAQRRWPEAIQRFEAAERLLAQAARSVPDPEALTSFFGTHDQSARGLREAYAALGETGQAFGALRRARRRHLLALARDQRLWKRAADVDWQEAYAVVLHERGKLTELARRASMAPDTERAEAQHDVQQQLRALGAAQARALGLLGRDALAHDERLREPRPFELIVAWLMGEHGVEAYATFGSETRHIRYPEPPQGSRYLEPLSDWLVRAHELTVLSFSEPRSLDVHALPFRGAPLIETLPVAYSLDLPPRAQQPMRDRHTTALLATDQRGDLIHATRELAALRSVLDARGWRVSELAPRQPADALAKLGTSHDLFYYAGHGRADDSGALRSALLLPDAELRVADILTLQHAPMRVVLSACEAARAPDLREAVGVSLAQAFVLAGSDEVLAPARPVNDLAAQQLSARVRDGLAARAPLAPLYQRALREAHKPPQLDAYAFRHIVP